MFVIGTGFKIAGQVTEQALACIRNSDKLLHLVEPVTAHWLESLNPTAETLLNLYRTGKDRKRTYREMAERMVTEVRKGKTVCTALYGHPGVFATPGHAAIRVARNEGYYAKMLPGISAADCLFADLDIDPAEGCVFLEATDFLIRKRRIDRSVDLVLWQIGAIGISDFRRNPKAWNPKGIRILAKTLAGIYGARHPAVVYETSNYLLPPVIETLPVSDLTAARVTPASTLYIPADGRRRWKSSARSAKAATRVLAKGWLTVTGLGYGIAGQVTTESMAEIRSSDVLFYLVYDGLTETWLRQIHPDAHPLAGNFRKFFPGKARQNMVRQILAEVRRGKRVVAAFSGHPSLCLSPSKAAFREAKKEGFGAVMLPGISAPDCLFADLGWDPAAGFQLAEAHRLIQGKKHIDPSLSLVVLQIGVAGGIRVINGQRRLLASLTRTLQKSFPSDHPVIVYEAAVLPGFPHTQDQIRLKDLRDYAANFRSTLFVPALRAAPYCENTLGELQLN